MRNTWLLLSLLLACSRDAVNSPRPSIGSGGDGGAGPIDGAGAAVDAGAEADAAHESEAEAEAESESEAEAEAESESESESEAEAEGDLGPPGDVVCGDSTCTPPETCCVMLTAGGAMTMCSSMDCGFGAGSYACDGPEDCEGGACCAQFGGGAMCGDAGCFTRLCHTDGDCDAGRREMCCFTPWSTTSGVCQRFCLGR